MSPSLAALMTLALAACDAPVSTHRMEARVDDPARLGGLWQQCRTDRATSSEATCKAVEDAYRHRFFSGLAGPDEFQSLTDLPPIPSTFDDPLAQSTPP